MNRTTSYRRTEKNIRRRETPTQAGRERAKIRKRKAAAKLTTIVVGAVAFLAFLIIMIVSSNNLVNTQAGRSNETEKYYQTITISYGDSLWSIADEYMTEDYKDINEYISEIKQINNLTGDDITAGMKLVVTSYR